MARFLLWNVHRKTLDGLVDTLVVQQKIDVVLLIEFVSATSHLAQMLLRRGLIQRVTSNKFGVFTRSTDVLRPIRSGLGKRVHFWRWTSAGHLQGLLVLTYGYDRIHSDDDTRRVFFRRIAEKIERAERSQEHQRTLVVGDFNAHPFESAIASVDGLHALGVKSIDAQASRKIRGIKTRVDFFYNPMWRLYGRQAADEAGSATHFWTNNRAHELAWHMIDQVVLRPAEAARFPEKELQIITRVGGISLVDADGLPDAVTASDHLPLVFQWDL
jgi:hypothetical protein